MKQILLLILLILVFLTAAKAHGRQHRLERELEGYWTVSFTERNDPWVEAFWLRQRVKYWSLALLSAAVMTVWNFGRSRSSHPPLPASGGHKWKFVFFLTMTVAGSMIVAFIATGLLSLSRLFVRLSVKATIPGSEWLHNAIWGSIGWWLLTALSLWLFLQIVGSGKEPS